MVDSCPLLKIVVTTRYVMDFKFATSNLVQISGFNHQLSVKFFLDETRLISDENRYEEILRLIKLKSDFPIQSIYFDCKHVYDLT